MVKYVYDAWGNHAVLHTNGNEIKGGIGVLNPFRYRGYYYDTETELYNLQTRYYDPEVGRFISQDSIDYADPETINGLNLYAYCGNNPVMGYDPDGTWDWNNFWSSVGRFIGGIFLAGAGAVIALSNAVQTLFNPMATVACEFGLTIGFYGAGLVGSVFNNTIYSDMNKIHWNPYNADASASLNSTYMSFYQGVPIIRANMGAGRSGSFGIIFLDRGENDVNTVKHEFGHIPQLMLLGPAKYGLCIGIPSKDEWHLRTPWTYYEAPWDAGADFFGGVKRNTLTATSRNRSINYLVLSYFLGPIVHSFYKLL